MNLIVFGTRPEEIKLCPFTKYRNYKFMRVNQSKDLNQKLIKPDYEVEEFSKEWEDVLKQKWKHVIVQGDTRTAFYTALKAYELGHSVAHVEAGLRTWDLTQPFPEEGYRRMIDSVSNHHFCPTIEAAENIDLEHTAQVVGQTSIDTLIAHAPGIKEGDTVLTTIHRREANTTKIARGLNQIALDHPGLKFIFIEHPNETSQDIKKRLRKRKWTIVEPMNYKRFIAHLAKCFAVITDSGGLQEEAPSLDKPVLVARNTTERPEGIDADCSILGGMTTDTLTSGFNKIVGNYDYIAGRLNPYGDGKAAERIHDNLKNCRCNNT